MVRPTGIALRMMRVEGGFLERGEQFLGHFQISPACSHFDVRLGETVKIASTGHQEVQSLAFSVVFTD